MMRETQYTYDAHGNMLRMLNISDNEKVFVRMEGGTVRYQYDNHLGSACLELDEYGYIISYEEYHPFGTTSYRAGRSATEVSWKRYKYCGKERDEETGLYYYGARYYAAWLCRFVSVDPLQHKQPGKTPYHYCSNNPISRIDPRGMQDDEPHKKKTSGLSINPKDTYAREDIKSLANNKRNAKYISFAESGTVTLDFGGLAQDKIDKILGQDEGLALINSLNTTANTEGVIPSYFYGTEGATGIGLENPAKQKDIRDYYSNITTLDNKDIYQKPFGEADGFGGYFSKAFILNASTTPYTSDGSAYGLKPLDGFDSKVYIGRGTFASVEPVTRDNFDSVSGKTIRETKDELVPKSRSGIVKHELKEALYRTALGMPYDTAHHKAGEITTVDRFYLHK